MLSSGVRRPCENGLALTLLTVSAILMLYGVKGVTGMPFNLGPTEAIVILVIVLVVFGVGRLPEVGGALGKGIREFRRSQTADEPSPAEAAAKEKNQA